MPEIRDKNEIMEELKKLLRPYSKKLSVKYDSEKGFYLEHVGKVSLWGRDFKELFFAAAMMHKGHVGFYFFPIYTHPKEFKLVPGMKKLLKGKSCFHVKTWSPELKKQITALLKEGYSLYKKEKLFPEK